MGLDSGSEAPINILTEAFLVGNVRDGLRVLCMEVNASSDIPKYLGGRCPRWDLKMLCGECLSWDSAEAGAGGNARPAVCSGKSL